MIQPSTAAERQGSAAPTGLREDAFTVAVAPRDPASCWILAREGKEFARFAACEARVGPDPELDPRTDWRANFQAAADCLAGNRILKRYPSRRRSIIVDTGEAAAKVAPLTIGRC